MAAAAPVLNQFVKATYTYFLVPGMTPYLTSQDQVLSAIFLAASVSNMVGRIATGFVSIWKLWILNAICIVVFTCEHALARSGESVCLTSAPMPDEFVVAVYPGQFPVSDWLLVPATVIMSGFGGYISTQVYMSANRECVRAFAGDTTHAKQMRQYVALANQIGSLVGTYACLLLASFLFTE